MCFRPRPASADRTLHTVVLINVVVQILPPQYLVAPFTFPPADDNLAGIDMILISSCFLFSQYKIYRALSGQNTLSTPGYSGMKGDDGIKFITITVFM